MPQTLLALLALSAVSVLTLRNSHSRIQDMQRAHRADIEVQSRGVAVGVLERISGYPFDGGEGAPPSAAGVGGYSRPADFGADVAAAGRALDALFADAAYDDVDDFDGVADAVARQVLFDPASGEDRALDLAVDVEVVYVRPDAAGDWAPAPPPVRTPHKQATVSVRHPSLTAPVRLGRIYAAP